MTQSLAQRLPAVQGPTAGGRSDGLVGHFMVPYTPRTARICNLAKAPARHAEGVPIMGGAPLVRRAVGRCAAARMARLDSARGLSVNGSAHGQCRSEGPAPHAPRDIFDQKKRAVR